MRYQPFGLRKKNFAKKNKCTWAVSLAFISPSGLQFEISKKNLDPTLQVQVGSVCAQNRQTNS